MVERMEKKNSGSWAVWRFRREVTLGTIIHLIGIVATIAAGWANLQSQLSVIQHDLSRVVKSNVDLQQELKLMVTKVNQQEYRIRMLEG